MECVRKSRSAMAKVDDDEINISVVVVGAVVVVVAAAGIIVVVVAISSVVVFEVSLTGKRLSEIVRFFPLGSLTRYFMVRCCHLT